VEKNQQFCDAMAMVLGRLLKDLSAVMPHALPLSFHPAWCTIVQMVPGKDLLAELRATSQMDLSKLQRGSPPVQPVTANFNAPKMDHGLYELLFIVCSHTAIHSQQFRMANAYAVVMGSAPHAPQHAIRVCENPSLP